MAAEQQKLQTVLPAAEPREVHKPSALDNMARLAALHDEAEETAILANLLGRAPYAAATLATLAVLTIVLAGVGASLAETAVWGVFMLIATAAFVRIYANAIRGAFERATLKNFHEDAKAVALYAGFAWGAGAFLCLPATAAVSMLLVFATGASAILAVMLRDPALTFAFVAPATILSAAAALIRPLAAGAGGAVLVLLAGLAVLAASYGADRLMRRSRAMPALAELPLS
jgi:hypothetical protein